MISVELKKKMVVSPFGELGLLPLSKALRSFLHVLVKAGRKECLISSACKLESVFVIIRE